MNTKQMMTSQKNMDTQAIRPSHLTPEVDIFETDEDLIIVANLPGVTNDGLLLEVSHGVLTMEGKIDTIDDITEQSYYRQFRLSREIDGEAGDATLKDGVLTLRLSKKQPVKTKKIAVKTLH